jgi:hypothetical protein
MPIIDIESYRNKIGSPYKTVHTTKSSLASAINRLVSLWTAAPNAGSIPTAAVICTNSTPGAILPAALGNNLRIPQIEISVSFSGYWLLGDRLSHQGGLSGTVITAQTTNLPTAALTRYTSGEGVLAALEIYTAIGTTATTVTASYTNSAGVAGRLSESVVIGGAGFNEVGRLILLPLQEGDTGVRSVQSVTVLATTGTAGNFGVTLFKPLFAMPILHQGSDAVLFDSMLNMCGNLPLIERFACVQWFCTSTASGSGQAVSTIRMVEE